MEKVISKLLNTSESGSFEKHLLNELFLACKSSPANINLAHSLIISKMEQKEHSQLRLNGLELINILFIRSKQFQSLVLKNSQTIIRICLDQKLEPRRFTALLERKIVKLITEDWKSSSPQFQVLKTQVLELTRSREWLDQFVSQPSNARENQGKLRSRQIKFEKYKALVGNSFAEKKQEMLNYQTQLNTAMDLLLPDFVPPSSTASTSSTINVPFRGILEVKVNASITETLENSVIFDAVRENLSQLRNSHAIIDEWLQLVSAVDHEELDEKEHESFLKMLIDLKVSILNSTLKAQELLDSSVIETDSDEEFEKVDMDKIQNGDETSTQFESNFSSLPIETVKTSTTLAPVFSEEQYFSSSSSLAHKEGTKDAVPKHLEDLYKLAPIVEYGEDLEYWTKKPKNVTFDQMSKHGGLEFKHRFLGESSAFEKYVPEQVLDNMLKRTIYIPEKDLERIQYPPCGALGKNGKICQRRDMDRCPFHGVIRPRDETGKLLSGEDDSNMVPIWQQIESQVQIPQSSRLAKRQKYSLEAIPKKSTSHAQRLSKKSKRLSKSGNDSLEASLKERDRQVFRW